ncbi:MAG: hypothetical protein KKA32_03255 [Actinobacteria bacterium]|nr:hypothetical protein [Actinomycetota bacterium]
MSDASTSARAAYGSAADRHPGDCAPYYAADSPALYHTRLDCPVGGALPAALIRVDHTRLLERLPYW